MILTIDPPVTVFSPIDDVRDWIVELSDLRQQYRDDRQALACIASEEQYAHHLLELIPMRNSPRLTRQIAEIAVKNVSARRIA